MSYRKLFTPVVPTQSAAIPFRIRGGRIEVLLITTRRKKRWIVPKGTIERDLSAYQSAQKEALEEAGVGGFVSTFSLGCYRHGRTAKGPIVEVFLMHVIDEYDAWPEQDERERRWVPLEEAYDHVDEVGLRAVLDEAAQRMRLVAALQRPYERGDEG